MRAACLAGLKTVGGHARRLPCATLRFVVSGGFAVSYRYRNVSIPTRGWSLWTPFSATVSRQATASSPSSPSSSIISSPDLHIAKLIIKSSVH